MLSGLSQKFAHVFGSADTLVLTERGPVLGAGADDCVSSGASVLRTPTLGFPGEARSQTLT